MSKKKKAQIDEPIPEPVDLENWDDWFNMCGILAEDLKQFEALMQKYYFKIMYRDTVEEQGKAQAKYQEKHAKGFYEREGKIPKWFMPKIAIAGFVMLLIGYVIAIIMGFVGASKAGLPLSEFVTTKVLGHTVAQYIGTRGLLIGGILAALTVTGLVLSRVLPVNKIFAEMRRLENKMEPMITYIPPKYRNNQSVAAFHDLYCTYGVTSFNQAITSCDDYLTKNNLVGLYMAVMFDVPYANGPGGVIGGALKSNTGSQSSSGGRSPAVRKNSNGETVMGGDTSDPALPSDILTKTFEGADDPDARLNELVGLDNVKTQVRQMKNRMNFYGGQSAENTSGNHMVFLGPPGTGKTTIARIITRILYDFGYIHENRCVEIDGGYLKSPYQGQTAERANAILNYAMGGVLFIDEAYILTEDKNGSSGAEAVGVLLKAMEDHRDDFVCILAGYEDNINRMLATNEGFASRIKHKIYFQNFTVDELAEIFRGFMRKSTSHRYRVEREAFDMLKAHFERELRIPGFGNARVVRNAWDAILDVHADRYMQGKIPEEQKYTILKSDMEIYIEARKKQMTEDGRNFIASRNLDSTVVSLQELKGKTKEGSADPDKDLARLTGLSVVKDEIARMKAQFEFYDGNMENNGYHMVFLGPPGTGKTTVASIMTGYLYKMGLISENSYLDINGDFLRGMYLGHTGKRTEAVVQYSQGMVLFIDEAYLLTSNDGTSDAFGQEAIGVLLDAMEKNRKNFVVIFAGYDTEMNTFLDVNSGLRSRISLEFHFQSYTPHELAQMFKRVAKDDKFTVAGDVWIPLQRYFKTQRENPKFGNGRFVRQFFEAAKKQHIVNYSKSGYGEDKKFEIQLADVEPLFDSSNTAFT